MPLVKLNPTWAQAASKQLNSRNSVPSTCASEVKQEQDNATETTAKIIKMEDNVNETQIAAAFSEGWGQRGINQDTSWNVVFSAPSSPKEAGSTWSNSTSTGTEIWETNVRHHVKGGTPVKPPGGHQPWGGHTPSTHIGGTWGEEEDTTDLWTGVPQTSGATWQRESIGTALWGGNPPPEKQNWGQNAMNPNWGNPNDAAGLQIGLPHMPMANDNKNMAALQIGLQHPPMPNENACLAEETISEGAAPWLGNMHKPNHAFANQWSPVTGGNKKMPTSSGWEETAPQPSTGPSAFDDGTAVWGNPVHQGKVSNWKEMPPANKQIPNCVMPPGNMGPTSHNGPGMIRMPQPSQLDPNDNTLWHKRNKPPPPAVSRNMTWNDPSRRIWEDSMDKNIPPPTPNSAFANWCEPPQGYPMGGGGGPYYSGKPKGAPSWADGQVDTSSWGGPMKQGGKPLSKDLIWASLGFRLLSKMNFKKEDIENALRRSNMNVEEALVELHALNKENSFLDMDSLNGRMRGNISDDMNFSDHSMDNSLPPSNMYGGNNFQGANMLTGFIAQNLKNQNSIGNNVGPGVLGNPGVNNQMPNLNMNNGVNNLSPAMMRKMLQQNQAFNPAGIPQNNDPMNAQLHRLVQQIHIAIQAGHLNPTIMNQPLCPTTLMLLFQLLQQMRTLQALQAANPPPLQAALQVAQAKQNLLQLQNAIASSQALFLKQQQQQQVPLQQQAQHPSMQPPQPSSFDPAPKSGLDALSGLPSEFRDLSVKDVSQGHSRLTQWKQMPPTPDDQNSPGPGDSHNSEFSRAPGSIAKSAQHSASGLQQMPADHSWPDVSRPAPDTWSDPSNDQSGREDSANNVDIGVKQHNSALDGKDSSPATPNNPSTECLNPAIGSSQQHQQAYNLNDLVPEFEPGKPWKGSQRMKNFDDDPHVTPGSIAKSPLSLKDSDLFAWNAKHQAAASAANWAFSPPPTVSQNSNSRSWSGRPNEQDRMFMKGNQSAMPKTSRPPPGLSGQNKTISSPNWNNDTSSQGWDKQSGSNFLVLKNLTPQIDGSTLKTLCLQHGPLQLFHLLLGQGVALVRYGGREEAEKARQALNNCVLSNTTILVDTPTDQEVKQYLGQQVTPCTTWSESGYSATSSSATKQPQQQQPQPVTNWNSTGISSTLWSYSGGAGNNGVWAMQSAVNDHDIPSSLNSYLPGDLLGGGESI